MTQRGFAMEEYLARVFRAQKKMQDQGLDALLLTTAQDILYITGFLTRFWESPTRPWFLILPAQGNPIAVIPSIGAYLMGQTWITDIRTWRAPDYGDDGVSLLADTLAEVVAQGGQIGLPSGIETHLRMPLTDWQRLTLALPQHRFRDDANILRDLRLIKSPAEIDKIRTICNIAGGAFNRVPEIARPGVPLSEVFRRFQMLLLDEGADWVPYVAGASAPGGYGDVISPASDAPLLPGDVMMLDTGAVRDGYFCDFDRNFSLGPPAPEVAAAHAKLIDATHAAFDAARPGATAADLFHAMDRIVTGGAGGSDAGRLGHGLGLHLTEAPSLIPQDQTLLAPGMVLTLEPGFDLGQGRIMVHEENIVLTDTGAAWLTTPQTAAIRMIE